METLYAVIDELYAGTVGRTLSLVRDTYARATGSGEPVPSVLIQSPHAGSTFPTSAPEPASGEAVEEPPQTLRSLATIIEERVDVPSLDRSVAYAQSALVPVFQAPTKAFDTVTGSLPYGTMVLALAEEGRFSRVAYGGREGWVLRDDLTDRAAYVYPEFVVGEQNGYDDPNTLRVRACIGDEFHGGETEYPLQAGEYVLYKLFRRGTTIDWGPERPRTPGRWHALLKGRPRVHMRIDPTPGSIMECTLEHDVGHLAYVEAVFPDERIQISEVNFPDLGTYNERTLSKEDWQALRAVFIEVG